MFQEMSFFIFGYGKQR